MEKAELFQLTARLRRSFPRHADVLAACDEVERLARDSALLSSRPVFGASEVGNPATKPKRDRAAYMRSYRARQA